MPGFSVVIPTLQRADELHPLVEMCAAHPRVVEVLVINNAPEPLVWDSSKVRVLQQDGNIFVNPAWNLGAREARGEHLAILNDDILFDPRLFDVMHRWLRLPFIGMIGPHETSFVDGPWKPSFRPAYRRTWGFGCAMFLRRENYVPIPQDLEIFYGDDWLFSHQRRRNLVFRGMPIRTEFEVTSGEYSPRGERELKIYRGLPEGAYGARFAREEQWYRKLVDLASSVKRRIPSRR